MQVDFKVLSNLIKRLIQVTRDLYTLTSLVQSPFAGNGAVMFSSPVWTLLPAMDYLLGPLSSDKPSEWPGELLQTGWDQPAPRGLTDYWDQTHLQDKKPIEQKTKMYINISVCNQFNASLMSSKIPLFFL